MILAEVGILNQAAHSFQSPSHARAMTPFICYFYSRWQEDRSHLAFLEQELR